MNSGLGAMFTGPSRSWKLQLKILSVISLDLAPRSDLWEQFPGRINIHSPWTTSGVINRVNQKIFWFFMKHPGSQERLLDQLIKTVQDDLGGLGRSRDFPILDIDASEKFPSFTKSISG